MIHAKKNKMKQKKNMGAAQGKEVLKIDIV